MSSAVGTGVGDTVVEYRPRVKLTGLPAFQSEVQAAWPYLTPVSVGVAVAFGYQLP